MEMIGRWILIIIFQKPFHFSFCWRVPICSAAQLKDACLPYYLTFLTFFYENTRTLVLQKCSVLKMQWQMHSKADALRNSSINSFKKLCLVMPEVPCVRSPMFWIVVIGYLGTISGWHSRAYCVLKGIHLDTVAGWRNGEMGGCLGTWPRGIREFFW